MSVKSSLQKKPYIIVLFTYWIVCLMRYLQRRRSRLRVASTAFVGALVAANCDNGFLWWVVPVVWVLLWQGETA